MNSFTAKRLRITLVLAGTNTVFPGTNSNTLVLENLRMGVRVNATARLATEADIRIYGMTLADMTALSVMWIDPSIVRDHIVILETNSTGRDDGWVQVFKGTIIEAQPDFRAAPDVSFVISAKTGYFVQISPAEPTSYPFEVDIGVAASDIIERMGPPWVYVDGGADGVLTNPYFFGTLWDQLTQACQAAKADFYAQGDQILVVPAGQPKDKKPAVQLTQDSGLVGYPMFERSGLNVTALYNPAFACGSAIDIESIVPNATGRWFPYSMYHVLESKTPQGAWFTQLQCLRVLVN